MALMQRTTGLSNAAIAIIPAPAAARTLNPFRVEITNPDTSAHIVDLTDATSAAVVWTLVVPAGGTAWFEWGTDGEVTEISGKMSPGSALKAQSRDAVVSSNMEVIAKYGRL